VDKLRREDLLDLVQYEKAREKMRGSVIELKNRRRVPVGDTLTFLFENRETVLLQIQEMIRTERIVDEDKIAEELATYNALVPDAGELSATLFIEARRALGDPAQPERLVVDHPNYEATADLPPPVHEQLVRDMS
jgi:hypothetical protein